VPFQLDVYRNPDRASAKAHPYLIVLQSDSLADSDTRVVAPLVSPKKLPLFERLMPQVRVEAKEYVIDVTNLGVVPARELHQFVINLAAEHYRIIGAIDLLFTGV
jgi:toxin CcdB